MKRSDRLVAMTEFFINNPHRWEPLTVFTQKYAASKSSVSEDLNIIHENFTREGIGAIERVTGAHGGVKYIPYFDKTQTGAFIDTICERLEDPDRILPGGYLYMSDLLGDPHTVNELAKAFVTAFHNREIDAVITVETKGIPLAYAVANYLNVPVVIIRRNMRVTEGSSVSINYVSARSQRIQTMVLAKRHLQEGMNVCIIDDFMKAGGTIAGMKNLLGEFKANVAGVGVLAEAEGAEEPMIDDYISLVKVSNISGETGKISVSRGIM